MFPIRDHNPTDAPAYITNALLFVNVVMFLLTSEWVGGMDGLWLNGALYPAAVTQGEMLHGLLTHMFLHAGALHLAGNMLFLWIFGDNLEEQMGHAGFLLFYLATGLAAAAAQIATDPQSVVPMVGASGAIAGVMGGYLLFFPKARVDVLAIVVILVKMFTVPAWVVLLAWFGLQLFGGWTMMGSEVAYWAHAGGFIAGVVLAAPVFLRRGGHRFWDQTRGHPPHQPFIYPYTRMPKVG